MSLLTLSVQVIKSSEHSLLLSSAAPTTAANPQPIAFDSQLIFNAGLCVVWTLPNRFKRNMFRNFKARNSCLAFEASFGSKRLICPTWEEKHRSFSSDQTKLCNLPNTLNRCVPQLCSTTPCVKLCSYPSCFSHQPALGLGCFTGFF